MAQVYVRKTTASVATPVRALKGFFRFHLQPGETRHIIIQLQLADLAVWNANQEWKTEPGEYTVAVSGSSASGLSNKFELGQ